MIALLLPLLALATPAVNTWTVDDDGPADFQQIADAVAQVPAGDVLLVEPGEYAGFTLTEPLTILGRAGGARPHILGDVRVLAPSFTLAGFDIDKLHVQNVSGRGHIDDCRVNVLNDLAQQFAATVTNCAQLVISRTTVAGSHAYNLLKLPGVAGSAVSINASEVTLVDCTIYGGAGTDGDLFGSSQNGGPGGLGLHISDHSHVIAAGSQLRGGSGGDGAIFHPGGPGGTAVVTTDSTVVVRGSTDDDDDVTGGSAVTAPSGYDIDAHDSTVVMSGVYTTSKYSFDNSLVVFPDVAEPYIHIAGTDLPGGTRRIKIHGPQGMTALLAASLAPAISPLAKFDGKLWFDPAALLLVLPVVMSGQDAPVVLSWQVPASTVGLEGLCVELQPFFPTIPGALDPTKQLAGNVAELIVRF